MRRFRRFRLRISAWARWAVLAAALLYLLVRLADLALLGPLAVIAENEARLRAIDAINRIVLRRLEGNVRHDELVAYEKDQQGRISAYTVNTGEVNRIASEAVSAVRTEFDRNLAGVSFRVPVGALTGSQLLSTTGPRIPVMVIPVGSVTIDIKQDFKAEGINQTRHRIWLLVTAKVRVVLPLVTRESEVWADLPVTETVIVGPVPGSFYGGSLGGVSLPAGGGQGPAAGGRP